MSPPGKSMGAPEHRTSLLTSRQFTVDSSHRRLSSSLWGIDWSLRLPHRLTNDGVIVEWSSFEQALPFVQKNYAEIFDERSESSPFVTKVNEAKARYYREVGDFFEFVHAGRTVGLLIGTP